MPSGEQLGFEFPAPVPGQGPAVPAGSAAATPAASPGWPRPLLRVTPARLGSWAACPRRYRLTYVDRPAPARGGPRAASTLGAVVHLALRALFELPAPARTPEAAAALVDRNWSGEGFRDRAQQDEYRERARRWLAAYVPEQVAGLEPLGVERWVSAPVGELIAEGRVDRIDPGPAGAAVVVDYKTGRHVPTAADARESRALALYALATERALHRPCRRVELHHLPSGTVAVTEHDEASLAAHLSAAEAQARAADDAARALAAGGDAQALFPARPGAWCSACDMRRNCPEGRAAGPEAQPWEQLTP